MTIVRSKSPITNQNQRGTILLVSLVLLLVMTVIGVATMEGSTLQERMASNDRQQTIAQNAAEFALRTAEQWVLANVQSTDDLVMFDGGDGLYSDVPRPDPLGDQVPLPDDVDVDDADPWVLGLGVEVDGLQDNSVALNPRYIIEYAGTMRLKLGTQLNVLNNGNNVSPQDPHVFRITAIGWSRDANIFRVLEGSVVTGSGNGVFTYN